MLTRDYDIKLIDFGLSQIFNEANINMTNKDYRGTGIYFAPETIFFSHKGFYNNIYSDTFVIGFLMLQLFDQDSIEINSKTLK